MRKYMGKGVDPMGDALALCEELSLASARLSGGLNRALVNAHQIGLTDLLILRALGETGAMRRGELASAVGMTASGVSRALRPLEKLGLVESHRDVRDARASRVALTDAGCERLSQASEAAEQHARSLLTGLYADEVAALRRLLGRIR